MDQRIVDLALSFDFWVFGGWVRDVLVCGKKEFGDIDIGCSLDQTDLTKIFLRVLSTEYDVVVISDKKDAYGAMSRCLKRTMKLRIGGEVSVDLCIFSSFENFENERSCDFSCNLFYRTRECPLAIRYTPREFQFRPTPVTDLLKLTVPGKFRAIYEPHSNNVERENLRILHVCERLVKIVKKGWFLEGPFITAKTDEHLRIYADSNLLDQIATLENRAKQASLDNVMHAVEECFPAAPQEVAEHIRGSLDELV
jgi:hypothetical protein